jgi:hypothetical protein
MPELRCALIEMAVPNGIWAQAEFEKLLMDLSGAKEVTIQGENRIVAGPKTHKNADWPDLISKAAQNADNTVGWYREYLPDAQLIHIEEKMVDFIVAAADAAPDEMTINISDAPSPIGLVVFAKPVYGTDAGPGDLGAQVRVDGIMWAPVRLPGRKVPWYEDVPDDSDPVFGMSIASLRMIAPDTETDSERNNPAYVPLLGTVWVPLGRTDWPWGDRLDEMIPILPNKSEIQHASMMEDRRLLAALWATINQKRLVETEIVLPDRHSRKRMLRAGHPAEGDKNKVQVIHLRRSEYRMLDQTEASGRKLAFRVPVRPHYKRQPYGPGRKLRRIILIPRHWRGPDDAPIKHTERIWEVDR